MKLHNHVVRSKILVYDDSLMVARVSAATVRAILKAELRRKGLSYADLADRLATIGVKEDRRNISNKIGRGSFTAVFFHSMHGRHRLPHHQP
jgi:Domain of unknown function (DUF6471)